MTTIADIQRAVAKHYGLQHGDILGQSRSYAITRPRQVAMYLSRRLTKKSWKQLGNAFGGRDHTTIIHGHGKVRELLAGRDTRRAVSRIVRGMDL